MRHDYGPFGAYYAIASTLDKPGDYFHGAPILYGSPRLHHIQCAPGVYYIRLAKDPAEALLEIDTKGEFLCDFRLDSADGQTLALGYMLTGDTSGMRSVTQMIVAMDELEGLTREQVIERRAGIMTAEFLGFVPAHVFMVLPDLAGSDSVEMDGEVVDTPRFRPGNWYTEDNPEFL